MAQRCRKAGHPGLGSDSANFKPLRRPGARAPGGLGDDARGSTRIPRAKGQPRPQGARPRPFSSPERISTIKGAHSFPRSAASRLSSQPGQKALAPRPELTLPQAKARRAALAPRPRTHAPSPAAARRGSGGGGRPVTHPRGPPGIRAAASQGGRSPHDRQLRGRGGTAAPAVLTAGRRDRARRPAAAGLAAGSHGLQGAAHMAGGGACSREGRPRGAVPAVGRRQLLLRGPPGAGRAPPCPHPRPLPPRAGSAPPFPRFSAPHRSSKMAAQGRSRESPAVR